MTDSDTHIIRKGTVESTAHGVFKIITEDTGEMVLGRLSGKMRMAKVSILLGDKVEMKVSVYSPGENAIITRRL